MNDGNKKLNFIQHRWIYVPYEEKNWSNYVTTNMNNDNEIWTILHILSNTVSHSWLFVKQMAEQPHKFKYNWRFFGQILTNAQLHQYVCSHCDKKETVMPSSSFHTFYIKIPEIHIISKLMSSAILVASPTTPPITTTNSNTLNYKNISFNLKAFLFCYILLVSMWMVY